MDVGKGREQERKLRLQAQAKLALQLLTYAASCSNCFMLIPKYLRAAKQAGMQTPSRFLLEPLPAAPALPPSMAVVLPGRSNGQHSEQDRNMRLARA